jgi:hypothetical protein
MNVTFHNDTGLVAVTFQQKGHRYSNPWAEDFTI